jgi:hypothetical protein
MVKNFCVFVYIFLFTVNSSFSQQTVRESVRKTYNSKLYVRETTGKNDGEDVEAFLKYTKLPKGNPWCAAFVCWTFGQNGVKNPRSAWSPSLFPLENIIYKPSIKRYSTPLYGDVFGIYFSSKGRIAHVGFIDKWEDTFAVTVEGNTNEAGSREGDGVYKKRRLKQQIYVVSRFIK